MNRIETIEYRGYDIDIFVDESPSNPQKEFGGEPPMIAVGDRDYVTTYGLEKTAPTLTREQIKKNGSDIAKLLGVSSLIHVVDRDDWYPHEAVDAINEAIAVHFDGLIWSDRLEMLVSLYQYQGTTALSTCREHVEMLLVATPQWLKETGAPDTLEQLENAATLYGQWAAGHVFGYVIEDPGEAGSCWGFYGDKWEENGLLEHAREDIDAHIRRKQRERGLMVKAWIRNQVPLQYRV